MFGFKGSAFSEREALARLGLRPLSEFDAIVRLIRPERRAELIDASEASTRAVSAECPGRALSPRKDSMHYYQKIRNYANRSNYYKLSVLEAANPWLDRGIISMLERLPVPLRVEKKLYRMTLERKFPELMRIPIAARNSLEDLSALMRDSVPFQQWIRHQLLERKNRFDEIVDPEVVAPLLASSFAGRPSESMRTSLLKTAKRVLGKLSPAIYQKVRVQAQGKVALGVIAPDALILRLLAAKIWADRL